MFNYLQSLFCRPERGWDPVDLEYAQKNSDAEWAIPTGSVLDGLEKKQGSLVGSRVLDLGGGAGQFSVGLAQRGAIVTWHDISQSYLELARGKSKEKKLTIEFSVGYLEEAAKWVDNPFDLIFCRICWYYCMNDCDFAKIIFSLIKPGGAAYLVVPIRESHTWVGRCTYLLNRWTGFKIGHPFPPPGRVERLFREFPTVKVECETAQGKNEKIWVIKN